MAKEIHQNISHSKRRLKEKGGNAVRSEVYQAEEKLKDALSEINLAQNALRKSIAKGKQKQTRSVPHCTKNNEVETDSGGNERTGKPEEGVKEDEEDIGEGFILVKQEINDLADEAKQNDDDW